MKNTNITTIRTYNLVDSNGNKLQLKLGRINMSHDVHIVGPDKGLRWSFKGAKIPMPVRNETWFNGFPEETMLDWLKANGWYPKTCAYMLTGEVFVFELPKANELEKTNEEYVLSELAIEQGEKALRHAVRELCSSYKKLQAVALYRYVHPCSLQNATVAVNFILDNPK